MVATIIIPRRLGAEAIGRLHLANSLWAMGLVVTAFGMNLALVKAVANDRDRLGSLLTTSVVTRFLIYIPVALTIFVYAWVIGYDRQVLVLLGIVAAGTSVSMVTASVSAMLRGVETMGTMSVAAVVGRFLSVFGAIILLFLGFGLYAVAIMATIGSVVALVIMSFALRRVRRELGDTRLTWTSFAEIRALLKESAPYFWMTVFIVFYVQIDTIIISLVVESDEVLGWYSAYDRLGGTLMFVPTVFMAAVFPTLSRLYGESKAEEAGPDGNLTALAVNPSQYNRLTEKTFQVMLLISVPIGFGFSAIAIPLAELLFGSEFSQAGQIMAVGGIVLSLTYLTTVLGMFLITMDRQRQWTWVIGAGALLTIPLDLVLVPFFQSRFDNGAIGGAVAYAVTESLILMGAIRLLPRGALGPSSLSFVARVLLAGLVMVAFVYPLRQLPLIVPVLVGAVAYVLSVAAFRLVAPEDRAMVMSFLPGALARKVGS